MLFITCSVADKTHPNLDKTQPSAGLIEAMQNTAYIITPAGPISAPTSSPALRSPEQCPVPETRFPSQPD